MARFLSFPLALAVVLGYSLAPAAAQVDTSQSQAQQAAWSSLVSTAVAAPTVAPASTEPEPTLAPTTAPTVAPTTAPTAAPTTAPTVAPTAAPTVTPTATPKPTPAPGTTPKPTIPPKPSPSPGVKPSAVQADVFARVVNAGSVLLREAPRSGAKGVVRAPKGQIVGILGTTGKWYLATFRGKTGYAPKSRLQLIGLIGEKLSRQYARIIVVDRRQQHMEVYENGQLMIISAITTGRPELPTPTGMMKVMGLESPHLFRSPWPESSQYWYPPGWADYTVLFRSGGFYFHDTRARPNNGYGIGSNVPHRDPDGVERTGSRGCVNTPWWAMQQLYGWAKRGDVVAILDQEPPRPPTLPGDVPNPIPIPNPNPPPTQPPKSPFTVPKGYWGHPGYSFE
jgi:hypothetical protein